MGYELFLLPVPDGADVEETGEALLVRLFSGHERTALSESGRGAAQKLAERLSAAEPDLAPAAASASAIEGSIELRARSGLQVALAEHFVRFLVPFAHFGEAAAQAFRQLFALAALAADATGWMPYDPQEGTHVTLDDESCEEALEIYLSVMDQLRSSSAGAGRVAGAIAGDGA